MAEWVRICEESRNFWWRHRDLWELVSGNPSAFLHSSFTRSNDIYQAREILSEILEKETEGGLNFIDEYPAGLEIRTHGLDGFVIQKGTKLGSIVPPVEWADDGDNGIHLPHGTRILFVPANLDDEMTLQKIRNFNDEEGGFFLFRLEDIAESKILKLQELLSDVETLQEGTSDELTAQMLDIVRANIELDIRRLERMG
jgi:hypothetical protein